MARRTTYTLTLLLASSGTGSALAQQPEGRWALCPAPEPMAAAPTLGADLPAGSTELTADQAELPRQGGVSTLSGNVKVVRDGQALRADRLRYSETERWAQAEGAVGYWSRDLLWEGARARWDLETEVGQLEQGSYRLPNAHGRGRAKEVVADAAKEVSTLSGVTYTTCPPGEGEFWRLDTSRLTLEHVEDRGSARDVVVRIAGAPVLYLPYLSFPLSDKRKTGFLWPTLGTSERSGVEVTTPFYWNIAPERDATLTPQVLGDRGVMLGGEYRYLMPTGQGQLGFQFLPSDDERDGEDRSLLAFNHGQRFFDQRLSTSLLYNQVSDKSYFEDFGSQLAISSQRFLERRAEATWQEEHWAARALFQGYQVVDPSLAGESPYQRLPQLWLQGKLPGGGNKRVNYQMNAEAVYFDRSEGVVGSRFDLRPSVSLPYRTPSGFLIPRLSVRYTQYLLDKQLTADNSPDRLVPYASLDSGLFFERRARFGGREFLQTLEPRLYYLYVPFRSQDDLPVFDTGEYDFTFDQLFREDRFSGPDRVGDTNQVTLALTSRMLESAGGFERFRASVGQIVYLEDQDVTLPGRTLRTDNYSDFILEAAARPTEALRARATLSVSAADGDAERATMGLRYQPDPLRVVNFDYRIRRDIEGLGDTDVEQTDASFRWPLDQNWGAVGRWVYSLRNGESIDSFGGVEYNSCCWGLRAVARRFLAASDGEYDTGVYVQLELKGLAGLGAATRTFLEESIPGYDSEF